MVYCDRQGMAVSEIFHRIRNDLDTSALFPIHRKINEQLNSHCFPVPDLTGIPLVMTGLMSQCLLFPDHLQAELGLD